MLDKFGNDLDYWYYCPICGRSHLPSFNHCRIHKKFELVKSIHKKDYYKQILIERQDYLSSGFDIVTEQEIKTNPLFNHLEYEKYQQTKADAKAYWNKQQITNKKDENSNIPKCPTCQSTNIKKISVAKRATHGFMFGIFSKTAFSQFECNNCGYKW